MLTLLNLCFAISAVAVFLSFKFRNRPTLNLVGLIVGLWFLVTGVILSNVSIYQANAFQYNVNEKLFASITYVQVYEAENGHLPSPIIFNEWANQSYPNWGLNYTLHEGNSGRAEPADEATEQAPYYRIEVWTGDETQLYDSFGHQFTYDFVGY